MTRFVSAAILALAMFCLSDGQTKPQSPAASNNEVKRFIGTWRLVSILVNGKIDPVHGAHPTGLLIYDTTGHMAAQNMPDRLRPTFAGAEPTPEEARSAITGYNAYWGTFTVDEKARTITHHIEGNLIPGGVGVDAARRYECDSNGRLILNPVTNPAMNLTWERIK